MVVMATIFECLLVANDQGLDFHITNSNMYGTHMHWKIIYNNYKINFNY